jgi:hypothetical protein
MAPFLDILHVSTITEKKKKNLVSTQMPREGQQKK